MGPIMNDTTEGGFKMYLIPIVLAALFFGGLALQYLYPQTAKPEIELIENVIKAETGKDVNFEQLEQGWKGDAYKAS